MGIFTAFALLYKSNFLSFCKICVSIPIAFSIGVLHYFLRCRKNKFMSYLELACKKISEKRLTIDSSIKEQMIENLNKTIKSNYPEKRIQINHEFIQKIESQMITMKEKLIKEKE